MVPPTGREAQLAHARTQLNAIGRGHFFLGQTLLALMQDGAVRAMGYGSLGAFLEAQLPGLGLRKANYLVKIAETFRDSGIPAEQLEAVGWSKLKECIGIPPAELPRLLEFAASYSADDVVLECRRLRHAPPPARRRFACTLHADQSETLDLALDACRRRASLVDACAVLKLIAGEWLAGQGGDVVPLGTAARSLETTYGVEVSLRRRRGGVNAAAREAYDE